MGGRVRALALVLALLAVGAFLGSAVSQWRSGRDEAATGAAGGPADADLSRAPAGERVRVEVLNGGGRADMARRATEHLRDLGFDVVYFGNADAFDHDSSVVLDRVGRPELARAVADALGARTVLSEPDENLFLDVTVVLGAAWEPPALPAAGTAGDTATAPWWDLRRFLPTTPGDSGTAPSPTSPGGTMADPGNDGR